MPKKNAQSDKNILNSKIKPKTLNFQINLRSEMFAKFYQRIQLRNASLIFVLVYGKMKFHSSIF